MRFLFALLFAGSAFAAPPPLTVSPPAPKPGEVVIVSASVAASYDVRGASEVTLHGKRAVILTMPDKGGVIVVAVAGATGKPADVAVLTLGSGAVPPGPGPQPPIPDPIVTPAKLSIYYIEESSDNVAGRGAMFANAELAARIKAKGHRWRVADLQVTGVDGKPPADLVKYLTLAGGKPVPQVFLVDESGTIRFQGDAPVKAADLLALITKYGG